MLISAQEQERKRIAQDLHDSLGGMLATLKLQASQVLDSTRRPSEEDVKQYTLFLDSIGSEIRRISHNMMPFALIRMGLDTALEDLANSIQAQKKLQVSFQSIDYEDSLSKEKEITLYRIAQELCANTLKHAEASHLLIQLSRHNGSATLVVEDDGRGFESLTDETNGIGLESIRSRVLYLGGELEVMTGKGEGTSVTIHVPVV